MRTRACQPQRSKPTRVGRQLLWLVSALVTTVACVPGCQPKEQSAPQPKSRTVVVYTSADQVFSEPVLKAFEQQSGIRVLPVFDVEATKTTGLVNRLIAEKARPQADVWWNNEFAQTLVLKSKGVLTPWAAPAAQDLPARYRDPQGYWNALPGRARVLLVNTRLVAAADYPKTLEDLTKTSYGRGQVGISNPLFGTAATHAAALYCTLGRDRALQFFKRLKAAGVQVLDGNSVVRDQVASGQLKVGLTDSDDAYGAIRDGAPVKVILPDQESKGTLVFFGTVSLVAGGPHPEEGRALANYLLSREVEKQLIASDCCQVPFRLLDLQPAWLGGGKLRALPVDFAEVLRQYPLAQQDLREIFVR